MKEKISSTRFNEIYAAAKEQENLQMFLVEYGLPEWILSEVTAEEHRAVEIISNIHRIAWMAPKEMLAACNLNQSAFSRRFNIPLRTIQDWCGNQRPMPKYLKLTVAEIFGLLKIIKTP